MLPVFDCSKPLRVIRYARIQQEPMPNRFRAKKRLRPFLYTKMLPPLPQLTMFTRMFGFPTHDMHVMRIEGLQLSCLTEGQRWWLWTC